MKSFSLLFFLLPMLGAAGTLLEEYRSAQNPYYWKNKASLTRDGYWQQDVAYRIDATLDETEDIISGEETIEYANNSPDTLGFVFFRLTQNAFQPGSYLDKLYSANGEKVDYGKYEQQGLGTAIQSMQHNGREARIELDNTILKVFLHEPLLPGATTTFFVRFKTWFDDKGTGRRRMKLFSQYKQKHYDGVHWYPRLSVYDRKFGWTTDQHLGREFYGDFGIYELSLNTSNDAVVEATGKLMNREEVLPDTLRAKLDIKNFASVPWGNAPKTIIPYEKGKRKTWKYKALNVHDVAFTSDPAYRIGEAWFGDVQVVSLAQEGHCSGWQNAATYTADILRVYSRDFGQYVYNKMVVADARDGMEYPMLTLDGGRDPDYRSLLAHEVGHNWFFGMVGNNETYRAMLDEGFTQFLTAWAIENIDGPVPLSGAAGDSYKIMHAEKAGIRQLRCYNTYLQGAIRNESVSINTHSDGFNGATGHGGGYRQVYYKTATMLWNLQYVLGDSLFLAAMKHYFNTYCIAHPYVEDFRNSIIRFTHVDLNWFFDQWIETYKTLDYSISKPKLLAKNDSGFVYTISIRRKADMQMPIEFTCTSSSGRSYPYLVPNGWFEKNFSGGKVLPRWIGWDRLQPVYQAKIVVPEKITKVSMDTSARFADCMKLDNAWPRPIRAGADYMLNQPIDYSCYRIHLRPQLFFNRVDGIKAGLHARGDYAGLLHRFSATVWLNSGLLPEAAYTSREWISYAVKYQTPISLSRTQELFAESRRLDGLFLHLAGIEGKFLQTRWTYSIMGKWMRRFDDRYLYDASAWWSNKNNSSVNLSLRRTMSSSRGYLSVNLLMRSGVEQLYAYVEQETKGAVWFGRTELRARSFARFGSRNIPVESSAWLAGANPETQMEDPLMRAAGWFPSSWLVPGALPGHVQASGGYNLRGYAAYLIPTANFNQNGQIYQLTSDRGVSLNTELTLSALLPKPWVKNSFYAFEPYAFFDGAVFNAGTFHAKSEADIIPNQNTYARANAGLGFTLTWKKWWNFEKISPFTLRADFPFYLSHQPYASRDNLQWNWMIGVQKSF